MSPSSHLDEPRWAGVRQVMALSWPIILGSLSYTVMDFTDKWMVAKLGTDALAAGGSAALASYTMSTLLLGIVSCVSTFVAQSIGRGAKDQCARYAWQGIYLSGLALLLVVIMLPVSGPLFRAMNHTASVTELELIYFRIRLLGYVPMAWSTALAAFFQSVNRPAIPMYIAIFANTLNIGLNYVLIFGNFGFPMLGIAGAAWATVIAQIMHAGLLQAVFLSRGFNAEFGTRVHWRFDLRHARELTRVGIPAGVSMFLDVANWFIFTSYVVGYFGAVQLAAHNVAISFMHVAFMPAIGVNQAIAAIVGQWIGRQDFARAKARTYTAIKISAAYMFAVSVSFAIFGEYLIAAVFSDDPEVIALGRRLLILAAIFQAIDAVGIICMGALRGAGDTRWMMWVTFVSAYLMFMPLAWAMAFPMGGQAYGAWIGATIYIIILAGVLLWRFHGEQWRHIRIFETDAVPPAEEAARP